MNSVIKKEVDKLLETIDTDVKLYLRLANNPTKKYEIAEFDIAFSKPTDHKGQPQHETHGGVIDFMLTELPDDTINRWMAHNTLQMSGEFLFERAAQSSILKVTFTDSYLVNYEKIIGSGGTFTRLTISPELININGKERLKIWAK